MRDSEEPPRDPVALYRESIDGLVAIGVERFGIDRADAEQLAQEVLLGSLLKLGQIEDAGAWLTAAMTVASRAHGNGSAGGSAEGDDLPGERPS